MKKLIVILVVIAIIVGVGISYFKTEQEQFGLENVLPQEAMVYFKINDVEENFERLAAMPFWQSIRDIDYEKLLDNEMINRQQTVMIDLIKDQLLEVINNPVSKRLFGKEVAVAVYAPDVDLQTAAEQLKMISPQFIEELLSGFFLVTRVDPDVQFAEFVSRFFDQFGSNITQETSPYRGEVIRAVTVPEIGMTFGVVRIKDLIVVGVGEKAAKKSVDIFNGDQSSLAQDPQFELTRNRALDPSHIIGYVNLEPFVKTLQEQGSGILNTAGVIGGQMNAKKQWDDFMANISGIKAFGYSSQLSPNIRFDSHVIFDPAQLSDELAPLYNCPPGENKTIRFVPKDVLGYHWSNCFQLDYYWDQIVKELNQAEESSSKIDELEAKIQMNIVRDVLPAFGGEIGGYIRDIQVGGFFPIPQILFFIEIKNKTKAEQLLSILQKQPIIMLQEENYKAHAIKYLALPVGQNIEPGYAFFENYLLISINRQLIRDSIDASQKTSLSLLASPSFKEIDFGLTDPSRGVQYLRMGLLVEKVKGVLAWSNQWFNARDRKTQAFKAGSTKPLEEVKTSIAAKEIELKEIRDKIITLEDDIWNLETKGEDVNAKKAQLQTFIEQLDAKKAEITSENERISELTEIVEEFDDGGSKTEQRQMILDELVYPILESIKSINTIGLRSTVSDNVFESSFIMHVVQ